MEHFIRNLSIRNFKSIHEADLKTERINVFVGKPNVGKSNVLEALSLFCAPFSTGSFSSKFLEEFIRYKTIRHLFTDRDWSKEIAIETDQISAVLEKAEGREGQAKFFIYQSERSKPIYQRHLDINGQSSNETTSGLFNTIKKYQFKLNERIDNSFSDFLFPPFGNNLLETIDSSSKLRRQISNLFEPYGLEVLIDSERKEIDVQKKMDGISYKTPYSMIADTLQRYIFHLAAIESNSNSVLLFEEPENHSFPPYIQQMAHKMIESETNQFFVATHSPYLLNTLVEESKEVAVFICSFENYETKFYRLTETELSEMLNYGIEIFFNLDYFLPDGALAESHS